MSKIEQFLPIALAPPILLRRDIGELDLLF
jgi:hypothetical protein